MRELKDYFCTYEQSFALLRLGMVGIEYLKHITPDNKLLGEKRYMSFIGCPLRSQALDFFRDKSESYKWIIDRDYQKYIKPDNEYETVEEAESALIDKLIELETEAQHGKSIK